MSDGHVRTHAGKVLHNHTGDVASDQFHKFLDDIDLMTQLNVDAYRFSISWSRIMKLGASNYYKSGSS